MQAKDIMSTEVVFVKPSDNAIDIGNRMESEKIGAVIVAEDKKFIGILSKETFVSNISDFCNQSLESLLVRDLMEEDVETTKPEAELPEVVDLMMCQKSFIERLPVVSAGKVVGLISLSDMTNLFTESMGGKYKVSDLMHYNPPTVDDITPLSAVIDLMKNMAAKRVLVMSGEKLAGLISVKDLSIGLFHHLKNNECEEGEIALKAEDVMTKNPITINMKADAVKAARIMQEKNIGGIPVIGDRLEGIINRKDLLKAYKLMFSK